MYLCLRLIFANLVSLLGQSGKFVVVVFSGATARSGRRKKKKKRIEIQRSDRLRERKRERERKKTMSHFVLGEVKKKEKRGIWDSSVLLFLLRAPSLVFLLLLLLFLRVKAIKRIDPNSLAALARNAETTTGLSIKSKISPFLVREKREKN